MAASNTHIHPMSHILYVRGKPCLMLWETEPVPEDSSIASETCGLKIYLTRAKNSDSID